MTVGAEWKRRTHTDTHTHCLCHTPVTLTPPAKVNAAKRRVSRVYRRSNRTRTKDVSSSVVRFFYASSRLPSAVSIQLRVFGAAATICRGRGGLVGEAHVLRLRGYLWELHNCNVAVG